MVLPKVHASSDWDSRKCTYPRGLAESSAHSGHDLRDLNVDTDACSKTLFRKAPDSLRGTKRVARKGVRTSVTMRVWTCEGMRVKHNQASDYLRPPFIGTPYLPLDSERHQTRGSSSGNSHRDRAGILALDENCLHFSICACHPCAEAMLIFSVPFQV